MQLIDRFHACSAASPADALVLRPGDWRDYAALAPFHYLRRRPGAATRILVLEDARPTIVERYLDVPRRETRNAKRETTPAGLLVESYPALACTLRDIATAGRYTGHRSRADTARLLNDEVRCISRVIVHPQWRGLGLAVRLVRAALATATTPRVEALAAMGRVHPFFKLAGMTEYRRWPHPRDQRLRDALAAAGVELWELASTRRMRNHLNDSPLLRNELARWAGRSLPPDAQLRRARDELLVEPVYYLWQRGAESDRT